MKQAQPMGQRMDQARARFRRAVESGEKAMQALQKAQENFEQAQQEVMQAQTELEKLMQEAPLPVMPVPQVNMSMVKSLEALTGIIENLWNPDAGPPPDDLVHAIQESRQILQTFSGYPVPGVWCSLGCRVGRRTGSRVTGPRRGRSRGDGGLRRGTCSRRAAGGGEAGTQSRGRTHSDDVTAAEEDANHGARGVGERRSPTFAGPTFVSASNTESQGHGTFCVVATSSQHWQVPKILHRVSVHCCVGTLQHAPGETGQPALTRHADMDR